jgi:hypothetical protein
VLITIRMELAIMAVQSFSRRILDIWSSRTTSADHFPRRGLQGFVLLLRLDEGDDGRRRRRRRLGHDL